MEVDQKENNGVLEEQHQNEPLSQAQSIINRTKKLQDELHNAGLKIKHHEENIKLLTNQEKKLVDSVLDLQGVIREYHSSIPPKSGSAQQSNNQSEDETNQQILQHENSAAGIWWQLKLHHGHLVDQLVWTKDVLGVVATLGKVEDSNLSRLLSEYLGLDTMLAIVCKTYESMKALEAYKEGIVDKESGLHGLGASIGRALDGRFLVICLEQLRTYPGDFVVDDPQRRLDVSKPRLTNGKCPPGFIGFAVNMINVEPSNLLYVTDSGCGLRETLFYSLFSRLQVYETREEMTSAVSLDGGMIRSAYGLFSLGRRNDVDLQFPKSSVKSAPLDKYVNAEKQLEKMKWRKEKLIEDTNKEKALLVNAKFDFSEKKKEFIKFMAQSSSYADYSTKLLHQMDSSSHSSQSSSPPSKHERATKRKGHWTRQEDIFLAKYWIAISKEAKMDNSQRVVDYWKRIVQRFNNNMAEGKQKTLKAIKNHWHSINKSVSRFNGIYRFLQRNKSSGWSDDQLMENAREMYREEMKNDKSKDRKYFVYEHVWKVLIASPRWEEVGMIHSFWQNRAPKRTNVSKASDYTNSGFSNRSANEELKVTKNSQSMDQKK